MKYPAPPKGGEWSQYSLSIFDDVAVGSGHTVIEAVAGSGKTTTIVAGLQLTKPRERVLFSAFNNRIVEELKERAPWTVDVRTLHSYGYQAVRQRYGEHVKPIKGRIHSLLQRICSRGTDYETREQLAKTIGLAKNYLVDPTDRLAHSTVETLMDTFSIWCAIPYQQFVQYVLDALIESMDEKKIKDIDFDDMIWLPAIQELPLSQYDRVCVDELQDLCPTQMALIKRAVKPNGRFMGVGDKNQAIYMWRGADSESIDNTIAHFSAKTLPLSICYRCPTKVVQLAKTFVPQIEPAPKAPPGIVGEVSTDSMYDIAGAGNFVLSRSNAPLLHHALQLIINEKQAIILGKDIGSMLTTFVRKSRQSTIEGLLKYTADKLQEDRERLLGVDPPKKGEFEQCVDRATCIRVLAKSVASVEDLLTFLEQIFSDQTNDNSVILSTVHKVKGQESNRVFILLDTFRNRREYWERKAKSEEWLQARLEENDTQEERNVFYVAVTRSKSELFLVKPDNRFDAQ